MTDTVKANRRLLASKTLLPCKGPNLSAFADFKAPITFLERLERPEPSGFKAYVFKVVIKTRVYALNVVRYAITASLLESQY
jgi:hypothetical protein